MTLTLSILRCPDDVAPETRAVGGGEFSIGRGPGNDWVLSDPERHLSKRHCVLAFRGGAWQLADLSTNGTFLNRETEPVGTGAPRALRDGDRLRLGAYEIELRITGEAAHGALPGGRAALNPFAEDSLFSPAPADPFRSGAPSIGLPADFDPLAPDHPAEGFAGPTQPDHTPAVEDAFRPPAATPLLPDDWDLDLSAIRPAPAPAAPAPTPTPTPPAPVPAPATGDLLAAFLRGAGLPDAHPTDAEATMEALGAAFRALVSGLRQTLIARAAVKGEFRIEQTVIRARGNNPLKFSAGDEDALAALLGTGRRTDMGPAEAVGDALRDIRLHELAAVAAMQSAVRALLAQLDPAPIRAHAEQGGIALVPAQRKARAWDAFEALYARTVQALSDDFDSVFGKAFARAYEQALREAAAREPEQ